MSARYRAAESVARDRKEPHVERREARASDRKEAQHRKVPGGFASRPRGLANPGVSRRSAPFVFRRACGCACLGCECIARTICRPTKM